VRAVQQLRGMGANVRVFDPQAMANTKAEIGTKNIYYAKDMYDAIEGVDAVCVLTEWEEFKELDLAKAKSVMKQHVLFDGRNHMNQEEVEGAGFTYFAIGKVTNGLAKIYEIDKSETLSSAILKNGK
jgi:UDPglucose 6-dehydrogenase